jgi:predicted outer membrane protein
MRKTGFIALALVPALAFAEGKQGRAGEQRQQAGEQRQQAGEQKLDEDLQKSLQKLHAANQAEVKLGQVAQKQAESKQVKQFAQRMVQDHQRNDKQLTQLARKMGVDLEGDEFQSAMKESEEKLSELQEKKGAEFDRAYMEHMVQDHEEDVQNVHDAAMSASKEPHPELAKLLGQTEGTLHEHHAMAQQVHQRLEQQGQGQQRGQAQAQQQEQQAQAQQQQEQQEQRGEQQAQQQEQQAQAQQQQAERQEQRGQEGQQEGQQQSVVGTVESVEEDTLTLKNELGETHEFALDEDTRFTRGGQSISKDQISEGDRVRASFQGEEGNFQATEISLMGGGSGGQEKQEKQD